MSGISTLDRVDGLRERIAELWVEGLTNNAIAEAVHSEFSEIEEVPVKQTIINWRKDDVVENKVNALMRARIGRIVRRTDAVIAKALDNDDMTVEEAIKIRKEFAADRDILNKEEKTDRGAAVADLFKALDEADEEAAQAASDE
jgi:hypothetical protein